MKNITKIFIAALAVGALVSSCKKGPDDPMISLRSRKARVTGDWTMKSGASTNSSASTNYNNSSTITYDGATYTENSSSTYNGVTTKNDDNGTYTLKVSFKKDGAFVWEVVEDGDAWSFSGTWNFTGKVGDNKNKEQIVLNMTSYTQDGETETYTGNQNVMVFNLKELRNKKMVIVSDYGSVESAGNSSNSSGKTEFTFEQ